MRDTACKRRRGRKLSHKLAAWNERRLLRDLYDCYFLASRLGEMPELATLDARLAKVASRLPALKKRREMSRADLAVELREAAAAIDERAIRDELAPLLPASEVTGLESRIRAAVVRLAEWLEQS